MVIETSSLFVAVSDPFRRREQGLQEHGPSLTWARNADVDVGLLSQWTSPFEKSIEYSEKLILLGFNWYYESVRL